MSERRRALLLLPDLTVQKLSWALSHPVHQAGVARWWHKSPAVSYLPGATKALDLLWPHNQVEWADLVQYLRANPEVAWQLQNGGIFRVTTGAGMVDWIPSLERLRQQFLAVEVVVDLIVAPKEDLTPWLATDLTIGTIRPAVTHALDNTGVHLTKEQIASYVTSRSNWSPIVVTKVGAVAVWVVDDRSPALQGLAATDPFCTPLSELERSRGTHLSKLLPNKHDLGWQGGFDGVARELSANPTEQLLITSDSVVAEPWPVVDDQLTRLLARLRRHDYSTLVVGAPQIETAGAYPLFVVDTDPNIRYTPVQRPVSGQDVVDATWEFIGASPTPSWLLRNFMAV